MRRRETCLKAFKLRVGHKMSRHVLTEADNPSETRIAVLVEGLQTPKDSASLRKLANCAEQHIQCADHSRVAGYIPDHEVKPCEMCNVQATAAIESQAGASISQ